MFPLQCISEGGDHGPNNPLWGPEGDSSEQPTSSKRLNLNNERPTISRATETIDGGLAHEKESEGSVVAKINSPSQTHLW